MSTEISPDMPRKSQVAVGKEKTGKKSSYTVEVRDPNGPIVKRHRKPIYGPGGAAHIPNGWWAINGMVLYAFANAGLGDIRKVEFAAMMLENLARREGVPDRTQDLAWLAIDECYAAATVQGFRADLYWETS